MPQKPAGSPTEGRGASPADGANSAPELTLARSMPIIRRTRCSSVPGPLVSAPNGSSS